MKIYKNGIYRELTQEELDSISRSENGIIEIIYEPTQADCIEAQVMYTAMMTDTLLEE